MNDIIKKVVITIIVLFLTGGGAVLVANITSRIHDSPEQKVKHDNHINEVPSDVENYKREVQLISQQKQLIEQTSKIDEFYGFAMKKFTKDSLVEKEKEKSRAGRDSINKTINQTLEYILKIIDTTHH